MHLQDLDYPYPQELIALAPSRPTRVAFVALAEAGPRELTLAELLRQFAPGDLLVVNNTRVIPARVFTADSAAREVLFLRPHGPVPDSQSEHWQVLFPARDCKVGEELALPGGRRLILVEKGLPQIVSVSQPLDAEYFADHGEMALPPYIQQARGRRHAQSEDLDWYQTAWAKWPGSVAAPTASLHFRAQDLSQLRQHGVNVAEVTLHVGAGTFLPVKTDNLREHVMHGEWAEVPMATWAQVKQTRAGGRRVWALGTTVTRTLEAQARGHLTAHADGSGYSGETRLFIYPPFEFAAVDALLTNFHQPKSTLLALVAAFAGLERVRETYAWAIERRFHLFSYGDLSAWIKP